MPPVFPPGAKADHLPHCKHAPYTWGGGKHARRLAMRLAPVGAPAPANHPPLGTRPETQRPLGTCAIKLRWPAPPGGKDRAKAVVSDGAQPRPCGPWLLANFLTATTDHLLNYVNVHFRMAARRQTTADFPPQHSALHLICDHMYGLPAVHPALPVESPTMIPGASRPGIATGGCQGLVLKVISFSGPQTATRVDQLFSTPDRIRLPG